MNGLPFITGWPPPPTQATPPPPPAPRYGEIYTTRKGKLRKVLIGGAVGVTDSAKFSEAEMLDLIAQGRWILFETDQGARVAMPPGWGPGNQLKEVDDNTKMFGEQQLIVCDHKPVNNGFLTAYCRCGRDKFSYEHGGGWKWVAE